MIYKLRSTGAKKDPIKRWPLADRVFFACGACHILAYVFLRTYPETEFTLVWIRPTKGFTGNHIVVVRPSPRKWATAVESNGYRAALVMRQPTLGLISSLPATAGSSPFISFPTSYREEGV